MTLLTDLQNAGLPVIVATDGVNAVFSRDLTEEESNIYHDILDPTRITQRAERADLKAQADAAITRLQGYQTATPPFTQAGYTALINSVKDMAAIEEKLLKVLRRII